jgi:hypothetical protein
MRPQSNPRAKPEPLLVAPTTHQIMTAMIATVTKTNQEDLPPEEETPTMEEHNLLGLPTTIQHLPTATVAMVEMTETIMDEGETRQTKLLNVAATSAFNRHQQDPATVEGDVEEAEEMATTTHSIMVTTTTMNGTLDTSVKKTMTPTRKRSPRMPITASVPTLCLGTFKPRRSPKF